MDGTLTVSNHDFDEYKKRNKYPLNQPLLETIYALPPIQKKRAIQDLEIWEEEIANRAQIAADTLAFLNSLQQNKKPMAIVTRNTKKLALITLQACNIKHFFPSPLIFGRKCAAPKPSPQALLHIMEKWNANPKDVVMVGDHAFDIQAGKAAGTKTIFISRSHQTCELADINIQSFSDLG